MIGSRKFKELIAAEKFEEATEIGRAQVKGGAQIIDVCLAEPRPRRDRRTSSAFYEMLIAQGEGAAHDRLTDAAVLEKALTYCQGKAIINSINLEDGEERFEKVVPLARSYGAALVVGCIDEDKAQAQAVTRERKLADRRAELTSC